MIPLKALEVAAQLVARGVCTSVVAGKDRTDTYYWFRFFISTESSV